MSLLAHVGKILTNLKSPFVPSMSEEKIKMKAGRLLFFLSETISSCLRTRLP